jgi:uncharacterized protein YndB with AHSA1/START domain
VPEKNQTPDPIVRTVWVDCPVADAFRLFTERFAEWWPLHVHSLHKEDAERCAMEPWLGGRIFERTQDGTEVVWGSIVAWEPPGRLEFTWCPGRPQDPRETDPRETVRVEFQVVADGARVTLIHSGWNRTLELSCVLRCFATATERQLVGSY